MDPRRRFLFVLAGHLGKSLQEVREFPEIDIAGWQAFNSIDPIGLGRGDIQAFFAAHGAAVAMAGGKLPLEVLPHFRELLSQHDDTGGAAEAAPDELSDQKFNSFLDSFQE